MAMLSHNLRHKDHPDEKIDVMDIENEHILNPTQTFSDRVGAESRNDRSRAPDGGSPSAVNSRCQALRAFLIKQSFNC